MFSRHDVLRSSVAGMIGRVAPACAVIAATILVTSGIASSFGPRGSVAVTQSAAAPGTLRATSADPAFQSPQLPGGAPTWQDLSAAYAILSRAASATAAYHDVRAAERAGYYPALMPALVGQGYHYVNRAYLPGTGAAFSFNPATPPVLVFSRIGGRLVFSGVIYAMPGDTSPRRLAAIFPTSLARWYRPAAGCATCGPHPARGFPDADWLVNAWIGESGAPGVFSLSNTPVPDTLPDAPVRMFRRRDEMNMVPPAGRGPTWKEIAGVYRILAATRAGLAGYQDIAAARRDGYFTVPQFFIRGQGAHYINLGRLRASARGFDAAHPPVLIYATLRGKPSLAGVMYMLPAGTSIARLAAIFPPSLASWHAHLNQCLSVKGAIVSDALSCILRGGIFVPNSGWMVHVWLWPPRETGLFAMDM